MKNFETPYFARSISEFWSRWHISLSTWFRDYVYFPLGGNRVPLARSMFNIGVVFLISGLWHGANWTFVIWGALHGIYYLVWRSLEPVAADVRMRFRAISSLLLRLPMNGARLAPVAIVPESAPQYERLKRSISFAASGDQPRFVQTPQTAPSGVRALLPSATGRVSRTWDYLRNGFLILLTFHLVLLSWVFFRAANLPTALDTLHRIAVDHGPLFWDPIIVQGVLAILLLGALDFFHRRTGFWDSLDKFPKRLRLAYAVALLFGIVLFGVDSGTQFIYFQF
jgi:hypothetical protein